MKFSLKDIISIKDFTIEDINYILKKAEKMEPVARSQELNQSMLGKILGMMFFEPSTRTRLSFETAMKRLNGSTVGFDQPACSSTTKGETLADTARMLASYSDAIVLRHNLEGAARYIADIVDVPVINAGDGAGQHPTQTLLDLYTMKRVFGKIKNLNVAIMGDLKYGRTVHSLSHALAMFGANMNFVSPQELRMPPEIILDLKQQGIAANETENIYDVLDEVDIIYVTRIQKERFLDYEDYLKIKGAYVLNEKMLRGKDLIVMHPLPRVDEISTDLDYTQYDQYFQQAFNGVPVRMALLEALINKK
jgi:aspartate carbamoyltransferase catalytic subunit